MIETKNLREVSKWAGILGVIMIAFGVISAISGVFESLYNIIPGIIAIVLGLKLRNAKKYAEEMLRSDNGDDTDALNNFVASLSSFFKIQVIMLIVIIIMIFFAMLLPVMLAFS